MALSPQSNEAFLREVDEELRKDQALHVWQNYGRWIIGLVVAGLIAFGGWLYWQSHSDGRRGEEGEKLKEAVKALNENKGQEAEAPLKELASSSSAGFSAAARFAQADALLAKNDLKGGAAMLAAIAADTSVSPEFRDLALIRQTAAEYDSLKPDQVVARLGAVAVKDSPWFGSAGEMVAIAQLRMGKRAEAGKLFADISKTDGVPEAIRTRSLQMAGVLGIDAVPNDGEDKKAK